MKTACSQCGGTIEIGPRERFIQCGFCQSSLLIVGHRTYRPLLVLPLLHAKAAAQHIRDAGAGLIVSAQDLALIFVPYWVKGPRLELAVPTLGAMAGLAINRPQPAGQLMFRQDVDNDRLADAEFLDPESGGEAEPSSQIVYIPHFRWEETEAGTGLLLVDGLEGTVRGLPDTAVLSPRTRADLIWCVGIFLAPMLVAIWGGPWWLILAGGLVPAGVYLLNR
ncbi:MAG: hypothetical protein JXQ27_13015 [Acidobacteria bacterium]|nr:hypothetical protein [Acidobacteriota bacterium]